MCGLSLCALLLLSSCTIIPTCDGIVVLKGEWQLRMIAWKDCPPCTFVRYEEITYKNICYFTDDKCGFQFTVSSVMHAGNDFAHYESTECNWDASYLHYVCGRIKSEADPIASQYGFSVSPRGSKEILAIETEHG